MGWLQYHRLWGHPLAWTASCIFPQVRLAGKLESTSWILFVGDACLWIRSPHHICSTKHDGWSWPTRTSLHCPFHPQYSFYSTFFSILCEPNPLDFVVTYIANEHEICIAGTFLALGRKRGDLKLLWTRGEPERVWPHVRLESTQESL